MGHGNEQEGGIWNGCSNFSMWILEDGQVYLGRKPVPFLDLWV